MFELANDNYWAKISNAFQQGTLVLLIPLVLTCFVGYAGIYRLEQNNTYVSLNEGLNMLEIRDMVRLNDALYLSNLDRIFKSEDEGQTWDLWQLYDTRFFELYIVDSYLIKTDQNGLQ